MIPKDSYYETDSKVSTDRVYQNIAEKVPYAIAITSLDNKFKWINEQFSILTGYSNVELIGKEWFDITYQPDIGADLLEIQKIIDGKIHDYTMTKRYIKKNGDLLTTDIIVYRYPIHGDMLMLISFIADSMAVDKNIKKLITFTSELQAKVGALEQLIEAVNNPNRIFTMIWAAIIKNWGSITLVFGIIGSITAWIVSTFFQGK